MVKGVSGVRTAFRLWNTHRQLTDRDRLARRWVAELDGDHTYRLDYPLDESSVVLDVGGYQGQFASDVFGRFCCDVHVYEPVPEYADLIAARFVRNPRIHVHAYGLAGTSRQEQLDVRGDRTSAAVPGAGRLTIELRDAAPELRSLGAVDLLKLNIEGLEYEVLESLLADEQLPNIRFLQIQFHDFVPDPDRRRAELHERLKATHDLAWDFPFVWESWTRRDG